MRLYPSNKAVLTFKNKASDFINAYTTNTPRSSQNAFVDIQGKIVAVVEQIFVSNDEIRVLVERPFKEGLLRHLAKYLALAGTLIEEDSSRVYFDLDAPAPYLLVTAQEHAATVTEQEFIDFKKQKGILIQGIDFEHQMLLKIFPEGLVSYTKGCYLGQEIIARVHFRGKATGRP